MALSAIQLCARALVKIGAAPILGFDEESIAAEVASLLYPSTRDALLSAHPWNFATAQRSLAPLVTSPTADYAYAFQLPADYLRALSAGTGRRGRGLTYRIAERRLHADADEVVLTYIFRATEADFPPFFDHVLIARLAAEFCIPLTENSSRAEALARAADEELRRARLIDAQEETTGGLNIAGWGR